MENKFRLDDLNGEFVEEQEVNGVYEFSKTKNLVSERTFNCSCNAECGCNNDCYTDCGCLDASE